MNTNDNTAWIVVPSFGDHVEIHVAGESTDGEGMTKQEAWDEARKGNPVAIDVFMDAVVQTFYRSDVQPKQESKGVVVEGCVYSDPEGFIYRVKASKTTGRLYAEVFDFDQWVYAKGATHPNNTQHWHRMTAEEAADFGHKTHKCVFCYRKLTTAESTFVGYGPVCAENHGLPWGEVAKA